MAADEGSEYTMLTSNMNFLLAMGFSYIQVKEACNISSENVNSMICYLVEIGGMRISAGRSNRRKGMAVEVLSDAGRE
jgi:OTU domain-containing protein 5